MACQPDWPLDTSCLPGWDTDPQKWTPEQQRGARLAGEMMWRLTAGRYGFCDELVRPASRGCYEYWHYQGGGALRPILDHGQWINLAWCRCIGACTCRPVHEIELPGPVSQVYTVTVDGIVLSPSLYRVDNSRYLVRTDGQRWPICQDLNKPDTQPGTWSIAYQRGRAVPAGGQAAAASLADELAKACAGRKCRLPDRVTTLTREGATFTLIDPQEFLDKGRTGITAVDMWLASVNPHGARSPMSVYTPDRPTMRYQA